MEKIISVLLALALLTSMGTSVFAEENILQTDDTHYETVVPVKYSRIRECSVKNGYFTCDAAYTNNEHYDELYSMEGELLLRENYINLIGDYIYVQYGDGKHKLLNNGFETIIAPDDFAHILIVGDNMALVVTRNTSDRLDNYCGSRSLIDLTTGETVKTYEAAYEYEEITLPDGTTIKPQEVNNSLKPGGGYNPYKLIEYTSRASLFNISTQDNQLLATVTSDTPPELFPSGYYSIEDRTGIEYSDQPGHCTLYNLNGEIVIPTDTFDRFYNKCDDSYYAIVEKDDKYGIIIFPAYTAPEGELTQALNNGYATQDEMTRRSECCTRLEFCQIVARVLQTESLESDVQTFSFPDCDDEPVLLAAGYGIVTGYPDGTFRPDAYITRQEAAVMLARFAATLNKQTSGEAISFADASQISSWATDAVAYISALVDSDGHAVMGGTGNNMFSPLANYTVEQAAVTVLRLMKCS